MDIKKIDDQERKKLIIKFLQEQITDQRKKLNFWKNITKQAAQIDTGYIAQHLISLITGLHGSTMRGKGDDLEDGSEVKSANFLDSLDKKGAIAPRWNFSSNDEKIMRSYLKVPYLFLVSVDLTDQTSFRVRVWKMNPREHLVFKSRYEEWMEKLGFPKLNSNGRPGVNFQLFPPKYKSEDNFARHGNGRSNGFTKLKILLEDTVGSKKILHTEERDGEIKILQCDFE